MLQSAPVPPGRLVCAEPQEDEGQLEAMGVNLAPQ